MGNSNEPYLNKPARCISLEKTNPVRAGSDRNLLFCLCDLLEAVNHAIPSIQKEAFLYAFHLIMQRSPRIGENVVLPEIEMTSSEIQERLYTFLSKSYEGQAPVALFGTLLKFIYPDAKVVVHPANEAGTSSRQVGDIDVIFTNGKLYAVEVKDKIFTNTDVNHAAEKVKNSGWAKMIFATGVNCVENDTNAKKMTQQWSEKGVDVSFVSIPSFLHHFLSILGVKEYYNFIQTTCHNLYTMRAKDAAIREFIEQFGLESQQ